jgi:hypothetical protein
MDSAIVYVLKMYIGDYFHNFNEENFKTEIF